MKTIFVAAIIFTIASAFTSCGGIPTGEEFHTLIDAVVILADGK